MELDNWLYPQELKHPYDIVPMEREDSCASRRCLAPLWTQRSPGDLEQAEVSVSCIPALCTVLPHFIQNLYRTLVSGELFGIIIWNSLVAVY